MRITRSWELLAKQPAKGFRWERPQPAQRGLLMKSTLPRTDVHNGEFVGRDFGGRLEDLKRRGRQEESGAQAGKMR